MSIIEVKKLGPNDIKEVLLRALTIEEGLNNKYKIEEDALRFNCFKSKMAMLDTH